MSEDPELASRLRAQALTVLSGVPHRRREAGEPEYLLILGARNENVTWQEIASALHLSSPQAAMRRYRTLKERFAGLES